MSTAYLINDAPLNADGWQPALLAVAKDCGARDVSIGALNLATMAHEVFNLPIDPH